MPKYKTYCRLYFRGKPTGRPYIYHKGLNAKNKKDAKAMIDKINRRWNKLEKKSGYVVKTAKVIKK